jgi:hypothetical protein
VRGELLRYIVSVKTNVITAIDRPTADASFRLLLQAELGRRCAANPRYSLRAFAKFLAVDHATLSQLLRGKRRLTSRMIRKLGTRLRLDEERLRAYCAFEEGSGSPLDTPGNLREVQQLAHDTVALITDWYHHAILELTHLQEFKPDSRWLARVLGLSIDEVNVALTRLVRLELLEMVSRDRWVDKSGDTTISLADFTRISIDRLATHARSLMLNALRTGDASACLHSSTTLALPRSHLAIVRERIERFQQELAESLGKESIRDDVFQVEISVFPVTNLRQSKENSRGASRDAVANRRAKSGAS